MHRKLLSLVLTVLLLSIFSVPLLVMAYASAGALLGGILFLGIPALLQIPLYLLFRRSGLLPTIDRDVHPE